MLRQNLVDSIKFVENEDSSIYKRQPHVTLPNRGVRPHTAACGERPPYNPPQRDNIYLDSPLADQVKQRDLRLQHSNFQLSGGAPEVPTRRFHNEFRRTTFTLAEDAHGDKKHEQKAGGRAKQSVSVVGDLLQQERCINQELEQRQRYLGQNSSRHNKQYLTEVKQLFDGTDTAPKPHRKAQAHAARRDLIGDLNGSSIVALETGGATLSRDLDVYFQARGMYRKNYNTQFKPADNIRDIICDE